MTRSRGREAVISAAANYATFCLGLGELALVRNNTGFKAAPIPGVVYGRKTPLVLNC